MSDTATTEGFNAGSDAEYIDPTTGEVTFDAPPQKAGALAVRDAIERLQQGRSDVFTTLVGNDFATKIKTLTAVTAATSLGEAIDDAGKGGVHLMLENIVVQAVEVHERDANGNRTDKMITTPRVILLDADGSALVGFSPTLLKSVGTFIGILGQPHTWPEGGVATQITREKAGLGTYFDMRFDVTDQSRAHQVRTKK